jgi:hypothetical protein
MPNAKDHKGLQPHQFLMLGSVGTGKTSQFLTLPGKKFAYLFDPNSILTLQGHDVDYEEFYPSKISMDVQSLSKDGKGDKVTGKSQSEVYLQWEKHADKALKDGFFDQYDNIMFDSATTLLDLIMDRILNINGRPGSWPHQDDYGPQMMTFTSVMRTFVSLGKTLYVTGHLSMDKDELTQAIYRMPIMTGKLKDKIPLLFSDIFATDASNDGKGKVTHTIQTVSDRKTPIIRCSIKGLNPSEDVTIDWSKSIEGQGLGGILNWEVKNRAKTD